MRDPKIAHSYSMIKAAYDCELKYKLLYIDKLQPPSPPSIDLEFGTAIHTAIQAALEGADAKEVFDFFWSATKENEHTINRFGKAELRDLGHTFIDRFCKTHLKHFDPIAIEQRMSGKLEDLGIEGTPDLVADYKGKLSLIDFKTSAYAYSKHQLEVNEQTWLYAELYRQNFGKLPDQLVYIVFCKAQGRIQVLTKSLTHDKLLLVLDNILTIIRRLTTQKKFPQNKNSCIKGTYKCEFFSHCYPGELEGE